MILNKLVEYCETNGMTCANCPYYAHCEEYSESMKHAPILNLDSEEEVDDK